MKTAFVLGDESEDDFDSDETDLDEQSNIFFPPFPQSLPDSRHFFQRDKADAKKKKAKRKQTAKLKKQQRKKKR